MLRRASKEVIYILDENPNKLALVPWGRHPASTKLQNGWKYEELGHNRLRKAFREIALWMKIQGTWSHFIQGNCIMDENLRKLVPLPSKEHARKWNLMNEKSKEVGPISWEKWDNGWAWRCFNFFGESDVVDEMKPHHPASWASIYPISCVAERFQLFHFPFSHTICLNFPKVEAWFAGLHSLSSVHLRMDTVAPEIQGSEVMASIVTHELQRSWSQK